MFKESSGTVFINQNRYKESILINIIIPIEESGPYPIDTSQTKDASCHHQSELGRASHSFLRAPLPSGAPGAPRVREPRAHPRGLWSCISAPRVPGLSTAPRPPAEEGAPSDHRPPAEQPVPGPRTSLPNTHGDFTGSACLRGVLGDSGHPEATTLVHAQMHTFTPIHLPTPPSTHVQATPLRNNQKSVHAPILSVSLSPSRASRRPGPAPSVAAQSPPHSSHTGPSSSS